MPTRHGVHCPQDSCKKNFITFFAAALALRLLPVADGSDFMGSLRNPAGWNHLFGFRPSQGRVPFHPQPDVWISQLGTEGPMARSVADAAALLSAITGIDPSDPASASSNRTLAGQDFTRFLDPGALQGARLGVARNFFKWHPRIDALMEKTLGILRAQGAELVDVADLPGHSKLGDAEYEVMLHEFKAGLNAYLASLGPKRTDFVTRRDDLDDVATGIRPGLAALLTDALAAASVGAFDADPLDLDRKSTRLNSSHSSVSRMPSSA